MKISKKDLASLEAALERVDKVMLRIQEKHPGVRLFFYDQGATLTDPESAAAENRVKTVPVNMMAPSIYGTNFTSERIVAADGHPLFDHDFKCKMDVGGL